MDDSNHTGRDFTFRILNFGEGPSPFSGSDLKFAEGASGFWRIGLKFTTTCITEDADISHWSSFIDALEARFPEAAIVVPGHGDVGDRGLFEHMRDLVSAHTP